MALFSGGILFKATQPVITDYSDSPQFNGSKFANLNKTKSTDLSRMPSILWRYIAEKRVDAIPTAIPTVSMALPARAAENEIALYRLGHSSTLLNLHGHYWLIDPVFSERASPFSFTGPKRFHQPPIQLGDLPHIAGVIISHDHYDHLDRETIRQIHDKVGQFIMPLGVKRHLINWGVPDTKITELDWWQHFQLGDTEITATPAQHFSGRGLNDGNKTLWASWVIKSQDRSIFFSGDSGYFDGFKEIGERFGPFDLTMMENGAYDKDWASIHMSPEETMQAHLDLGGKHLMPVHNSTFDLALHPWYEPFERISELAEQNGIELVTPVIGEKLAIDAIPETKAWWRALKS